MMQFSGFQRICATVQTSPQPTSECDCHSEKASSPLPSRLGSWTSHRPWTARCALAVSASVPTWGYFLVTFTAAVIKKKSLQKQLDEGRKCLLFSFKSFYFFWEFYVRVLCLHGWGMKGCFYSQLAQSIIKGDQGGKSLKLSWKHPYSGRRE